MANQNLWDTAYMYWANGMHLWKPNVPKEDKRRPKKKVFLKYKF